MSPWAAILVPCVQLIGGFMSPSLQNDLAQMPARPLWWLNPLAIVLGVAGTTFAAALWLSDAAFQVYGTPKYLAANHVWLVLAAGAAFAVGRQFSVGLLGGRRMVEPPTDRYLRRWFFIAFGLTLFGYALWTLVALKNGLSPGLIKGVLMGDGQAVFTLKEDVFKTIPGVTTCTQFAVAAAVLGTWLIYRGQRDIWPWLAMLAGLAVGRALLLSERLALIETAAPCLVLAVRVWVLDRPMPPGRRFLWNAAPLAAAAAIVLLFGAFESFRSWHFYKDRFGSIAEFTVWRLTGYYATSHNNGALALEIEGVRTVPLATLLAFWEFPLIEKSPFAYDKLVGQNTGQRWDELLTRHGSIELNNPGGLFQPTLDYGYLGGFVWWGFYGALCGWLHLRFLQGRMTGLLLYPVVITSLLELPRFLYLPHPRILPTLVLLGFVAWRIAGATVPKDDPVAAFGGSPVPRLPPAPFPAN